MSNLTAAGPDWVHQFPGSNLLADLDPQWKAMNVDPFMRVLLNAGAQITYNATYRPPQRAYLMHYCCLVAGYRDKANVFHQIDPQDVPAYGGSGDPVLIDWTCGGDIGVARTRAVQMRDRYGIAFPAALVSRHTERKAIDITIHWKGVIVVKDARDVDHQCEKQEDLWPIGASFGVHKLPSDPPHWSTDGH